MLSERFALVFPVALLGVLSLAMSSSAAAPTRTVDAREIFWRTTGTGSIPGILLRDGTVCATDDSHSFQCRPLGKLPAQLIASLKNADGLFDGIFDLEGAGTPQVFVEYWRDTVDPICKAQNGPEDCDETVLLIYRKVGDTYGEKLKLTAPSYGYDGGAWFLNESPRKAIIRTRCGGSSGPCLFFLDLKKRALQAISDDIFLEGEPVFTDIDGDGNAEIMLPARGRDRTASQGAALLHWTGD